MITHEEARKYAHNIITEDTTMKHHRSARELYGYVNQQEKVGELLELYRKHINNLCEIHRVGVKNSMHSSEFVAYELYEQIKQLEKELGL